MEEEIGMTIVRPASESDLAEIARLFDAYRVFYEQPSAAVDARNFIAERLAQGDSHILVAEATDDGPTLAGFVQLYPSFTSVGMNQILILNDLFVDPAARSHGVGRALMDAVRSFAQAQGAVRLSLATAHDNVRAQGLYEALGYIRDSHFYHYDLALEAD